jgi:phage gp36-like protein
MAYCTLADIDIPTKDLIELTDDNNAGVVDQTVIDKAIAAAGELIDGYLRGRYTLPLVPLPGLMKTLALDLVVYRLYTRRVRLTPPEAVADRYKNSIKILDQIATGKISLGTEAVNGQDTPETGGAQSAAPDRVFTRDNLWDY